MHIFRQEPYRLLFPIGILLIWAGLFHWFAFATSRGGYHQVFHSIAMIQGFLMSFGVGFLLTALPRRTGTPPPSMLLVLVSAIAPIATSALAWFGLFAHSQTPWLIQSFLLYRFASAAFKSPDAGRRAPASFVWVPVALLMGTAGIAIMAVYGAMKLDLAYHEFGKLLILQGVFVGLVIGVGGMVLPLIIRGESALDDDGGAAAKRTKSLHLLAAVALIGTIAIESFYSARLAYGLRGLVVLIALLAQCGIHKPPTKPGLQRWLVWLSAWFLPIGYFVASAMAPNIQPGLHLSLIGGFGLMALGVGFHISFAHGGRQDLVAKSPWQVPIFGLLVLLAIGLRAMVNIDPAHMQRWIGLSAGTFLFASLIWVSATWRLLGHKSDPA